MATSAIIGGFIWSAVLLTRVELTICIAAPIKIIDLGIANSSRSDAGYCSKSPINVRLCNYQSAYGFDIDQFVTWKFMWSEKI